MFKSLWTKFGAKILIIACSVLLLGGVAIASPKLRADPQTLKALAESGGRLWGETKSYANGAETLPEYIYYDPTGGTTPTITLVRGTDFEYSKSDGVAATNASDDINGSSPHVWIQAKSGSSKISYDTATPKNNKIDVPFTISKHELGENESISVKISNPDTDQDYITVATLTKTYVSVIYNNGTTSQSLDPSTYEIVKKEDDGSYTVLAAGQTITFGQANTFYVNLTNYESNNSSIWDGSCTMKKDVSALEIPKDEINDAAKTFTVKDADFGDVNLFSSLKTYGLTYWFNNPSTGWLKIKADATSKYYINERTIEFNSNKQSISGAVEVAGDTSFEKYIDYDSNRDPFTDTLGSFRQYPEKIELPDGTVLSRGDGDFEVDPDSGYTFLSGNGVVGEVQVTVTGKNLYTGSADLTYYVCRDINKASDPSWGSGETQTFSYTGAKQRPSSIVMTDGTASLTEKKDFTVSYLNHRAGRATDITDNDAAQTEVGTVRVTLTGTGEMGEKEGYYGTHETTLEYYIDPMSITNDDFALSFTGKEIDAGKTGSFPYTGDIEDIKTSITTDGAVCYSGGKRWKYLHNLTYPTDYRFNFPKGNQASADPEGNPHTVELIFSGNYTGTLSAKYEVTADRIDTSTITVKSTHVYDGTPQEVKLEVLSAEGHILPESAYEIEYLDGENGNVVTDGSANTNAGTVYYRVKSTILTDDVKTYEDSSGTDGTIPLTFEIQKRDLSEASGGALKLDDSYPFAGHQYTSYPDVQSIKWNSLGTNGYTLIEGKDYTIKGVSSLKQDGTYNDLTDESKVQEHGYPRINDKRYSLILSAVEGGNFKGTVYTDTFKFTPKSISSGAITVDYNEIVNYVQGRSNDAYVYTDASIKLYDSETKETLRFDNGTYTPGETDYYKKVAKQDYSISYETGPGIITVTLQGKNAYEDSREIQIKVGRSLNERGILLYKGTTQIETRRAGTGEYIFGIDPDTGKATQNGKCDIDSDGNLVIGYGTYGATNGLSLRYKDKNNNLIALQYNTEFTVEPGGNKDFYYEVEGDLTSARFQCVIFKGIGNGYYDEMKVWFPVNKTTISNWTITLDDDDYTYNGKPIYPTRGGITFEDASGNPMTDKMQEGVDYKVTNPVEPNNIKAGTANIILEGLGKYQGSKTIPFTIGKKDISDTSDKSIRVAFVSDNGTEITGKYLYSSTSIMDGATYNGVAPTVAVYYQPDDSSEEIELTRGTSNTFDYNVSFSNNDKITSDASVTITANNVNYKGARNVSFEITPINLETDIEFTVENETNSPIYTGEAVTPTVTAKYKGTDIEFTWRENQKPEYVVTYRDNYAIGAGSVLISYNAENENCHCVGENIVKPFYIKGNLTPGNTTTAASITSEVYEAEFGATADSIYIKNLYFHQNSNHITGTAKEIEMKKGEHYTLSDVDTSVGIHYPTVNAKLDTVDKKNAFTGTLPAHEVSYLIYANLANASYTTTSQRTITYTSGQAIDISEYIDVTCGGRTWRPNVDYVIVPTTTIHVGKNTAIVTATGEALETGILRNKCEVPFTVQSQITEDCVTGVKDTYEYKFGARVVKEGDVRVKFNGDPLDATEYTVTIENETDVTESGGRVIVTGKGFYGGSVEIPFKITPYNINDSKVSIEIASEATYTGNTATPKVVLKGDGQTLVEGRDYRVSAVKPAIEMGPHTVIVEGISGSNYTGSYEQDYTIVAQPVTDTSVVTYSAIQDQTYRNGKEIKPGISVRTDTRTLVEGTDYTLEYRSVGSEGLYEAGTKEVLITGIKNYSGTHAVRYEIVPKDISETDVTAVNLTSSVVYNGKEQHVSFGLSYDGDTIMTYDGNSDTVVSSYMNPHPEVKFSNATDVTSSASITITARGDNYKGEKTLSFKIKALPIKDKIKYIYYSEDGEQHNLKNYKLRYSYTGSEVKPQYRTSTTDTAVPRVGVYYDDSNSWNNNALLVQTKDFKVSYIYIEPDTDDTPVREEYEDDTFSNAGKVLATITGVNNYEGTSTFVYYIGDDISDISASLSKTSTVYNAKVQKPSVNVNTTGKYTVVYYKNKVSTDSIINDPNTNFVDADNYYVRIEGVPTEGTYASKPTSLTYTITRRPLSAAIVIDGFKKEYNYTGSPIAPIGIAVTDYIDDVKYKLSETKDYTLSYTNNTNVGSATINVNGINNFQGTATARFTITSSKITSGNMDANANIGEGIGSLSTGDKTILPSDVRLVLNAANAMYYTGQELKPTVTISGLAQNVGYTVTYSNNIEVGTGVITITGIGNNSGTITKYFRIIADLDKCTVSAIPEQMYTGSAVTPLLTVTCGNSVLKQGTDYTVVYTNNINVGTATATLRAASNANYVGSKTVNFVISTNPTTTTSTDDKNATGGGFYVTGYSSSYTYTGSPIRPTLVVQSGNTVLKEGTDYTVTYSNNVNVGTANITVTGIGKYSGTQNLTFEIVKKDIQATVTSGVSDKVYTGDVYTPSLTVTDGNKTLTNGVDYTVTYSNNTEPGIANITIQGMNSYTGTKTVSFKISGVSVSGLKANTIKSNSISLVWNAQEYADGYQICNKKSKVVKTVSKNSASMTGLSSGKTYKYKVRSYVNNADGTKSFGGFSSVVSATTKLSTPSVKIVSSTTGQAKISWSKVSGATGYEIYYKKSANGSYKKLKTINSTTVRNCIVKGMKSGDRYYFRVRAFKKTGSSKIVSAFNPLKVITIK